MNVSTFLDVTASLNGEPVNNHQLLYFDEIGFNQSTGLVCSGLASDVCCYDQHQVSAGGVAGSQPNGVGSWVYPNGQYVRFNCSECVEMVEEEEFLLHRTSNTTILYRNENVMAMSSGIYRCEIPLNISDGMMPLTQYVGIYEPGKGKEDSALQNSFIAFNEICSVIP